MDMKKLAVGVMVLALAGSAMKVVADDAPTTKPAEKPKDTRGGGIIKPFSLLTDLTDDQKAKLAEIHRKELDEVKKLQEQEKTDDMALLTDDQKQELSDLEAKAKADEKAATEARHAKELAEKAEKLKEKAEGATTAPAN